MSTSVSPSVMSDSLRPIDCSPLGSSVHGILQARILDVCECQGTKDGFEDGYRAPEVVICSQGDLGSNLPLPFAVLVSLGKSLLFHSS